MPALSVAAAVALALGTGGQPPCVPMVHGRAAVPVDLLLSVAMEESHLDPGAVGTNDTGSRDWGLLQVNDANLGRLGLTPETALDACKSIRAGSRVLLEAYDGGVTAPEQLKAIVRALSRYNTGSPTRGTAYAERVLDTARTKIIPALAGVLSAAPPESKPASVPTSPEGSAGSVLHPAKPGRLFLFSVG